MRSSFVVDVSMYVCMKINLCNHFYGFSSAYIRPQNGPHGSNYTLFFKKDFLHSEKKKNIMVLFD